MKSIMNFKLAPMAASMVLMVNRCRASDKITGQNKISDLPDQTEVLDLTGQTKKILPRQDVLDLTQSGQQSGAPARPKRAHREPHGAPNVGDFPLKDPPLMALSNAEREAALHKAEKERNEVAVEMLKAQNSGDSQKHAELTHKLAELERIIKKLETQESLRDSTDEPLIICQQCGILTDQNGNHVSGNCPVKPGNETVRHLREIHRANRRRNRQDPANCDKNCLTKQILDELNTELEKKETKDGKLDSKQKRNWLRECFKTKYRKCFKTKCCKYTEKFACAAVCCAPVSICYQFLINCEKICKPCEQKCPDECCKEDDCNNGCFPDARQQPCWMPASWNCIADERNGHVGCTEGDRIECHESTLWCLDKTPGCLATTGKGIGHCLWNFAVRTPMKLVCIPYKTWKLCKRANDSPHPFLAACAEMAGEKAAQEPDQGCCTNDNCEKGCRCFWKESCGWCWCCCVVTGEAGETIEGCAAMAELCQILAICPGN